MNIAGLVRTSTVDFPGRLAAVVFTPGCNYDCFYCHNRSLICSAEGIIKESEVVQFLERRQGLLDGLVITGGEPLLQAGLADFIRQARALGYAVKLDTNGSRPDRLHQLIDQALLDYVAIDYKAPWLRYSEICGVSEQTAAAVEKSIRFLMDTVISWEARTTVIPQLDQQDLKNMARALPPLPAYYLQLYRQPAEYRQSDHFRVTAAAMSPAALEAAAQFLQDDQPQIKVRC